MKRNVVPLNVICNLVGWSRAGLTGLRKLSAVSLLCSADLFGV